MEKHERLEKCLKDCTFSTILSHNENSTKVRFEEGPLQFMEFKQELDESISDIVFCTILEDYISIYIAEEATEFSEGQKKSIEEYFNEPNIDHQISPKIEWRNGELVLYMSLSPIELARSNWFLIGYKSFPTVSLGKVESNDINKEYKYRFKHIPEETPNEGILMEISQILTVLDPDLRLECHNCSEKSVYGSGSVDLFHCNNCFTVFPKAEPVGYRLDFPFSYSNLQKELEELYENSLSNYDGLHVDKNTEIKLNKLGKHNELTLYDFSITDEYEITDSKLNEIWGIESQDPIGVIEYDDLRVPYNLETLQVVSNEVPHKKTLSVCDICTEGLTHRKVPIISDKMEGNINLNIEFCKDCLDELELNVKEIIMDGSQIQSIIASYML